MRIKIMDNKEQQKADEIEKAVRSLVDSLDDAEMQRMREMIKEFNQKTFELARDLLKKYDFPTTLDKYKSRGKHPIRQTKARKIINEEDLTTSRFQRDD